MLKIKCTFNGYSRKPTKDEYWQQVSMLKAPQSIISVTRDKLGYLIGKGHAVILAEFKGNLEGILTENIIKVDLLALDVDSKDNPITKDDMIILLEKDLGITPVIHYCTFSDVDNTRFRLIYRFEKSVSAEHYKLIYKSLVGKYGNYLDNATTNANRIWQGTNKEVVINKEDQPLSKELIDKLIKEQEEKEYTPITYIPKATKKIKFDNDLLNQVYISSSYKREIVDIINTQINIYDFIISHFGGYYKKIGGRYVGSCPLHGGNNKSAFNIFTKTNTYSCFTHCGSGNVVSLAYRVYNTNDFSSMVLQLINDYNISIPEEAIKIKKRGDKM